jgi:hypothetical protein
MNDVGDILNAVVEEKILSPSAEGVGDYSFEMVRQAILAAAQELVLPVVEKQFGYSWKSVRKPTPEGNFIELRVVSRYASKVKPYMVSLQVRNKTVDRVFGMYIPVVPHQEVPESEKALLGWWDDRPDPHLHVSYKGLLIFQEDDPRQEENLQILWQATRWVCHILRCWHSPGMVPLPEVLKD